MNSNHGLALFRHNQILRPIVHRNLPKYNNEDFFIQLLNARLHLTNNDFPTPTSSEEIFDQPLFLNSHTKLDFNSNNPYFYRIPPNNISDKFNTLRDIYTILQPGFVSPRSFKEKLNFPTANYNNIYKFITQLIPGDWHGCSNQSNLEMAAYITTKYVSYLNLNISGAKNGRSKL